jgi:GGDEF domain-containing protein
VGVAPFAPGKHYTIEELIAEADADLYREKEKHKH